MAKRCERCGKRAAKCVRRLGSWRGFSEFLACNCYCRSCFKSIFKWVKCGKARPGHYDAPKR